MSKRDGKDKKARAGAGTLRALTTSELRARFERARGHSTNSRNRAYLIRALEVAGNMSSDACGGEPASAGLVKLPATAGQTPRRDPRIPASGAVIEREYDGGTVQVTVLDDGFEYRGRRYRSLSVVAKEATGTVWNGLLFFKLIPYKRSSSPRSSR